MAIKLLAARYAVNRGYRFRVHLDTTKVLEDGSPDPLWVRVWTYGEAPPAGVTVADYRTRIQQQTKALAQQAAQEMADQADAGSALPSEGQEI